jgi:hypothetical protein
MDAAHAEASPAAKVSPRELICQVRYASDTRMLRQAATPDPYAAATVDFENRFRFRAVALGTDADIAHITLTVYELAESSPPVIVHQARHQAPFDQGTAIPALTGWNHVYAAGIGRELRYGCALRPPGFAEPSKAVAP